jgi:hypothetical protein
MPYCYPDPTTNYPEKQWKTWYVFGTYGTHFGTVRAPRKALACFHAERNFKLKPGEYYVGKAD